MTNIFLKRIAAEWDLNVCERAVELESRNDESYFGQIIPQTIALIEDVPRNDKILDVGCGLGYLTNAVKRAGFDINGIDISSRSIAYAKNRFQEISFLTTDLGSFSKKNNNEYKVCLAIMLLHNSFNLVRQFRYINELLDRNGQAIICIPHPCFWYKRFGFISYTNPRNSAEKLYKVNFKIRRGSPHKSKISYYHRTLETYYSLIKRTGFRVDKLIEHKDLKKEADILFLVLRKI